MRTWINEKMINKKKSWITFFAPRMSACRRGVIQHRTHVFLYLYTSSKGWEKVFRIRLLYLRSQPELSLSFAAAPHQSYVGDLCVFRQNGGKESVKAGTNYECFFPREFQGWKDGVDDIKTRNSFIADDKRQTHTHTCRESPRIQDSRHVLPARWKHFWFILANTKWYFSSKQHRATAIDEKLITLE
jgi:hypothetical protein